MVPSDYRVPAEHEPHRATWLLWPTRPDNWRAKAYFGQSYILSLAAFIAHFEPVRIGAPPNTVATLQRMLPPGVSVVEMNYDDTWVRDTGPIVLVAAGKNSIAVHWRFNSWGGLFSSATADNRVASEIAIYERMRIVEAPIVLEGGALICDGAGTIILTEESVLAENRNPGLTRSEAEIVFRRFLNVSNIIWLPHGLLHDEAGGHVDNVCAFAPGQTILVAASDDPAHPSFERLREAKAVLKSAHDALRKPYELVKVPLPAQAFITAGEAEGFSAPNGTISRSVDTPLAASHINFYATAKAIFLPTFNSPSDATATEIVAKAFPRRRIIPFPSREFLLGGGAIHCLTRDIPG